MKFHWGTVSGTKIETLSVETVKSMIESDVIIYHFLPNLGLQNLKNEWANHLTMITVKLSKDIKGMHVPVQACS